MIPFTTVLRILSLGLALSLSSFALADDVVLPDVQYDDEANVPVTQLRKKNTLPTVQYDDESGPSTTATTIGDSKSAKPPVQNADVIPPKIQSGRKVVVLLKRHIETITNASPAIDVRGAVRSTGQNSQLNITVVINPEKARFFNEVVVPEFLSSGLNVINGQRVGIQVIALGPQAAVEYLVANGATVWYPSTSMVAPMLAERFTTSPFYSSQATFYSPMVFALWQSTETQLKQKYGVVNFQTLVTNMLNHESQIPVNFRFANPADSETGLLATMLMSLEFYNKDQVGSVKVQPWNLNRPNFQQFVAFMKANMTGLVESEQVEEDFVNGAGSGLGNGLHAMLVQESAALNAVREIAKLGDVSKKIKLVYPAVDVLSENPFYILRHDVSLEQIQAAEILRKFILSREMQKAGMKSEGLRPVNWTVVGGSAKSAFSDVLENGWITNFDTISGVKFVKPVEEGSIGRGLIKLYTEVEMIQ